jgi:hypothetical protein
LSLLFVAIIVSSCQKEEVRPADTVSGALKQTASGSGI